MGWNEKYWDTLDQLYWTPKYLGFRSIPKASWRRSDGWVGIPEDKMNLSASLYTRDVRATDLRRFLQTQEEILNHIFDITFAIAPDSLLARAFLQPLGFSDGGPFLSVGREARQRYGWDGSTNNTQQDGLFVSGNTVVGVELKLTSASSAIQVAKYAALFAWEQKLNGPKDQVGLLYIVPESALGDHWAHCGTAGPSIPPTFVQEVEAMKLPRQIRSFIENERELWESTLRRMVLGVISWRDLRRCLADMRDELDPTTPGDQTLVRLIDGFLDQLAVHHHTGLVEEA